MGEGKEEIEKKNESKSESERESERLPRSATGTTLQSEG